MFQTPEFWVLIAFVLLITFLGKRAYGELANLIDERTNRIQKQLSEAQRLYDEALSLLDTYQKKYDAAVQQAKDIISHAEAEAQDLKKSIEDELTEMIRQKEKSTQERIQIAQDTARTQLKDKVVEDALSFVEEILAAELKTKSGSTKSEAALDEIATLPLKRKSA